MIKIFVFFLIALSFIGIAINSAYKVGQKEERMHWGQCVQDALEHKGNPTQVFLCRYGRAKWQQKL